jgi:hypothetical protein
MRNRILAVFTTWPFVLALAVLLVNDALLKQAYPGFITGKLSDFAGLAVVSLPLFAAFPRHTRSIYLALSGAFLWWKSPASDTFITFMNDAQPLLIGRTVDYGDLIALAVLPACAKFVASGSRGFIHSAALRRWILPPVLAATLFGVMATSAANYRKDFDIRAIESSVPIPRDEIVDAIKEIAVKRGLKPGKPNLPHWEGSFEGSGVFLTYSFRETNEIAVGIQGELRKGEKLRDEIKRSLSLRFNGLNFVEPPREH